MPDTVRTRIRPFRRFMRSRVVGGLFQYLCRVCGKQQTQHVHAVRSTLGLYKVGTYLFAPAELVTVRVENNAVFSLPRRHNRIIGAVYGGEVYHNDELSAAPVEPSVCDDIILRAVRLKPRKTVPSVVYPPQLGRIYIQMIEPAQISLHLGMARIRQHEPLELVFVVPFAELRKLGAHERQLLSGHGHKKRHECAHHREFFVILAVHLSDE